MNVCFRIINYDPPSVNYLDLPTITSIIDSAETVTPEDKQTLISRVSKCQLPPELKQSIEREISDETIIKESLTAVYAGMVGYIICDSLEEKIKPHYGKSTDNRQVYSAADILSGRVIAEVLKLNFPEYGRLDEEVEDINNAHAEKCWITDPLDGSAAFVRDIDWWAVGIALHENEDIQNGGSGISFGVIVRPTRKGMQILVGGKALGGCWNNTGEKATVSQVTQPSQMSFSVGSRDVRTHEWISSLQVIGQKTSRVIAGVDTQYTAALVAQGNLEFLVRVQQPSYDVAPAIGVIEGAGGKVSELDGSTMVVQRDKVRRHSIFAWNGEADVSSFFTSLYGLAFDTLVAVDASVAGTSRMKEVKLIEALRSGGEYRSACLLPKHEQDYLIKKVNRFGEEGQGHWDFGLSKPVSPDSSREMASSFKLKISEINDFSNEIRQGIDANQNMPDLDPIIDPSHSEHFDLIYRLNWPNEGSLTQAVMDLRGIAMLDAHQRIDPNPFLPKGGENSEIAHCAIINVPVNSIPENKLQPTQWVTRSQLMELAQHGELTLRLQKYIEHTDFDAEWEPEENEVTQNVVRQGGY